MRTILPCVNPSMCGKRVIQLYSMTPNTLKTIVVHHRNFTCYLRSPHPQQVNIIIVYHNYLPCHRPVTTSLFDLTLQKDETLPIKTKDVFYLIAKPSIFKSSGVFHLAGGRYRRQPESKPAFAQNIFILA